MAREFGADAALGKSMDGEIAATWLDVVRRLLGESAPPVTPSQTLDPETWKHMAELVAESRSA